MRHLVFPSCDTIGVLPDSHDAGCRCMIKDGCALGLSGEAAEIAAQRGVVLDVVGETPAPSTAAARSASRGASFAFDSLKGWAYPVFLLTAPPPNDREWGSRA